MKTKLLIIIGIAIFSSIIYFGLISVNDSTSYPIIPIELKVAQKLQSGASWHFSGTVIDSETEIKMSVRSPDGNIISTDTITPSENGNFEIELTTGGPLWANAGKYLLILEQGEFKEIQTFEILEYEIPVPLGTEGKISVPLKIFPKDTSTEMSPEDKIIELLNSSCNEFTTPIEWEEITSFTEAYDLKYDQCIPTGNNSERCAMIGFKKYSQNEFDEFLGIPSNKNVNFLYLTYSDLKKIPVFYVLIQDAKDHNKIFKSLDVGSGIHNGVQDFFTSENQKQLTEDESNHTKYFILNNTLYRNGSYSC